MTFPSSIRDSVLTLLNSAGFAVLATENARQPHTSLVAITALDEGKRLVFATYRNTQKFTNLLQNPKVSLLIDGRHRESACGTPNGFILSAVGRVQHIDAGVLPPILESHLNKHPDLMTFTQTPDCVLLEVLVDRYQVVRGIDDVTWWCVDDLAQPAQKN